MSKEAAAQSKKRKGGNEPVVAAAQKRTRISTKDAKDTTLKESDEKITSISARNAIDRKQKPAAKSKKAPAKKATAPADDFAGFSDSDNDEPTPAADQTALISGFSDSDDDETEATANATAVPAVPADVQTQLSAVAAKDADPERVPGTVYVGRLPHGFHEPQLHGYFSQFGDISRLRVSRNKATGKPKHYAFIEFASAAVADIVARTMDKYLLFGHIMQVRKLAAEEVHPELWKGAGKRYKALPKAKLERGLLERGRGREAWEKKVKGETRRRKAKAEQLKELGYEFDMPQLKKVAEVPRKAKVDTLEGDDAAEIEAPKENAVETPAAAAVVEQTAAVETSTAEEAKEATEAPKRKSTRKEKTITKRTRLSQ